MGSVEQDLHTYLRDLDQAEADERAAEHAAYTLRAEIEQDTDDLETLMLEAVEHGDFPFSILARMLTIKAHTDDPREFIRRLRAAIEPRLEEMVSSRVAARVQSRRDQAEQDRAEAILESRDSNL